MLSAIDLDDEPFFEADEIENVAFELRLAAKLEVRELSGSQQPPHRGFGVGRSVTHLFCEDAQTLLGRRMVRHARLTPHPARLRRSTLSRKGRG